MIQEISRLGILTCLLLLPTFVAAEQLLCQSPSTKVEDREQRYLGHGFSILPPDSGYWCYIAGEATMRSFVTNKFMGREISSPPKREELTHSFAVVAMSISVKEADQGKYDSLQDFLEVWVNQGSRGFDIYGPVVAADLSPQENFEATKLNIEVIDGMGAECLRYDLAVAERKNPGVPRRWVLVTSADGVICRHPDDENLLIDIAFSERKREGWEDEDAGLRNRFRAQAEASLTSLQFSPVEDLEVDDAYKVLLGDELKPGVEVQDSLDSGDATTPNGGYYESWHIKAKAGQKIDVRMNSDDFDAMLIIGRTIDGIFAALTGDDDGGRRTNARLKYKIPEDGDYIIMALSATPGGVGSYSLELRR